MINRQLLDELKRSSAKTNFGITLRVEREFKAFLLSILDNPGKYQDYIDVLAPYFPFEMSKILQPTDPEAAFSKILRLFEEGDNPVSVTTSMTNVEKKYFLCSLLPPELKAIKQAISKMDFDPQTFTSFAHTFMYYHILSEENEQLESRIKTLLAVKHESSDTNDGLLATSRTVKIAELPSAISSGVQSSSRTPISTPRISAITAPRVSTQKTTVIKTAPTATRNGTVIPPININGNVTFSSRPQTARIYDSARITPQNSARGSARESVRSDKTYLPQINTFVRDVVDMNEVKDMTNIDLRKFIEQREASLESRAKLGERYRRMLCNKRRDSRVLIDEIKQLELEFESSRQKEIERREIEMLRSAESARRMQSSKREANLLIMQIKDISEENKRLKEELMELESKK